jgi:hypothetical protein
LTVAAASPDTISDGIYMAPKKPSGASSRYKNPAVLTVLRKDISEDIEVFGIVFILVLFGVLLTINRIFCI